VHKLPHHLRAKDHDEVRDGIIMILLGLGVEVQGAWEDWKIVGTGATPSELWGSERTEAYDRKMGWWLEYTGDIEAAKKQTKMVGGRHPPKDCILPGTKVEKYDVPTGDRYYKAHIGYELTPPEQEDRKGEFIPAPPKKRRLIVYKCKKCGHEWHPSRRYSTPMRHRIDGGEIELIKFEMVTG